MALIKSISGIRGTIGGKPGEGLSGIDIVKFTAAFTQFIKKKAEKAGCIKPKIVVGRDARLSGDMVDMLVCGTIVSMGVEVINIGKASTPTTELAVVGEKANGGIIITASHNPLEWNALKLLNEKGEFISDTEGKEVVANADSQDFEFAQVLDLGKVFKNQTWNEKHIDMVCNLPLVNVEAIGKAGFKVAVDAVNSVGGEIIPQLLRALGVKEVVELNCEANGKFAHTPEPIPENLLQISSLMKDSDADLGVVVDPDVDRLALVMENGEMFGEENTLVAVADYVLGKTKGATVSNLSSSRALKDVTEAHGCSYSAAAVGEVNVVTEMKKTDAVIGGEGNGGVIYPELHYGRDALVGIGLFLSYLAEKKLSMTALKASLPSYVITKNKIALSPGIDVDAILLKVKEYFKNEKITDIDGVKIDFDDKWVHLRKSNTEPIIRIYAEAHDLKTAEELAEGIKTIVDTFI